jgi:hypothetical protein
MTEIKILTTRHAVKFSYSMVFSVLLYLAGLKHVADIYFFCCYYLHVISQNIYTRRFSLVVPHRSSFVFE